MCKCCTSKTFIVSGILLLLFVGGFIALGILFPNYLKKRLHEGIIDQRVVTSNSSAGYKYWVDDYTASTPETFKITVFNVTNVDEVLQGKPASVKPIGPFIYTYKWHYFNISWHTNETLVDVFRMDSYILQDGSPDPKTTFVTIPNIPLRAVKSRLGDDDEWWKALAYDIVSAAANTNTSGIGDPFVVTSVQDLIWGAEVPLLKYLNNTFSGFIGPLTTSFGLQTNDSSETAAMERVNYQKDTYYTGKSDTNLLNHYAKWRGLTKLNNTWGSEEANEIFGGNGLGIGLDQSMNTTQKLWVEQIFRHVDALTNTTIDINGIDANVYFLNVSNYRNNSYLPEYFLNLPNGASNLSSPESQFQNSPVPIIVTQPYFFNSDRWYLEQVKFEAPGPSGPNETLHNTFVFIEPNTGLTIKAFKRLQVSLEMEGSILLYPNMSAKTVIPVAWFEQSGEANAAQTSELKNTVVLVTTLIMWIPILAYILAGVLTIASLVLFVMSYMSSSRSGYEPVGVN